MIQRWMMVLWLASGAAWAQGEDASAPVVEPGVTPAVEQGTVPFTVRYACASGQQIRVRYPAFADAQSAPIVLQWKEREYQLGPALSASGARYASRQLVWWTKGDSAFLSTRGGRLLVRRCVAQSD